MRRLLPAMALVVLVACTPATEQKPPATSAPATEQAPPKVPPEPRPAADGPCPYLDEMSVEKTNGQRVSRVRISTDKPHPSCFFYRADGTVQLTARVYLGEVRVARALIDKVAPVDTSNPATQPTGWEGGYQPTGDGAVYAVANGPAAVVVTTNQRQTVKAREITKQVIASLALG
ncbi:MAG: DUF2020 domain-containing protein [Pseudonocardiaceae bacterium]|nr:DUF2020 domain-containing protein [Pseudonocardiaceae bacterium]